MINITKSAIAKIKEISESEDIGHYSVRLKVIGGGCSGLMYDIIFDDIKSDLDESAETDGIVVIADQLSLMYLDEITIDYIDGVIDSGFRFSNTATKSSCGCGKSFSI
jgi:iron-sulfur cluster assembly accessory protein